MCKIRPFPCIYKNKCLSLRKTGGKIMSKSISLQQSVMQDVVSLMNDNGAMKKLQAFLKELKKEKDEELTKAEKE